MTGGAGSGAEATLDTEFAIDFDGASLTMNGGAGSAAEASFGGRTIQVDTVGAVSVTAGSGPTAAAGAGSDDTPTSIVINSGGDVTFTGGGDPTAAAGLGAVPGCVPAPCDASVVINSDQSVILQSGTAGPVIVGSFSTPIGSGPITITAANGGTGDIQLNDAILQTNGVITLTVAGGTGTITQSTTGTIDSGTNALLANTAGGVVTLPSLTNAFADLTSNSTGGDVTISKTTDLVLTGIDTGAGALTLNVTGQITQTGAIKTTMLTSTSTGALTLDNAGNDINTIQADVTVSGDITFRTTTGTTGTTQVTGTGLSTPDGMVDIDVTGAVAIIFVSSPITAGNTVDIQAGRVNANAAITTPGSIILNSVGGVLQVAGPLHTTGPGGDIILTAATTTLNISDNVTSDFGSVIATSLAGELNMNPGFTVQAAVMVDFDARNDILLDTVIAPTIDINTLFGNIGVRTGGVIASTGNTVLTAGGPIGTFGPVFANTGGTLTVNTTFAGTTGNITVEQQAAGSYLTSNLVVNTDAGSAQTVDLTFLNGLTVDANLGNATDALIIHTPGAITAGAGTLKGSTLLLDTGTGIGGGTAVLTEAPILTANSTSSGPLNIDNTGPVTLNLTSTTPINFTSTGNILLGTLSAPGVTLTVPGTILDGNGAADNIIGGGPAVLVGSGGIGSFADPLETVLTSLDASVSGGDLAFTNTGNLTVSNLNTPNGNVLVHTTGGLGLTSAVSVGSGAPHRFGGFERFDGDAEHLQQRACDAARWCGDLVDQQHVCECG